MKKYVAVLSMAIFMLLALVACGNNDIVTPELDVNGIEPDLSYQKIPQADNSEANDPSSEGSIGILHQFDNLGFSVEFPAFWEGKYGLIESHFERDSAEVGGPIDAPTIQVHLVSVYHIATREELYALYGFEHGGNLFNLGRAVGEHFTYDNAPIMAGGSIFLAQTGGYTYFVNFPSGVEFNSTDPNSEAAREYLKMADQWEEIASSFRLMD